ncbi:PREDICTED: phospholipase B1, membrane-associated-like [Priapulus caudatus]|uniref:Phospholipase B1, membrane-associated-like n=1 Tax=Priapulus caudatus TaxID=37621 RepID=A0ABM1EPA6_PRICU|nr:PREDICTED: phospholipase B1, membrane-associated-like [Priapulus caudatus]
MNRALMLLAVLLLFAAWTQPLSGFGELPEPLEATDPTDPPEFSYEEFKKALPELFEKWKNLIQIHPHNSRELGSEFNCSTKKPPGVHKPPKSVHELTPFDVQVVAALGDSLTAANGAKGIKPLDCLTQYRGVSWSIGGDKNLTQVVTLPNILRNYNKDLRGFSLYEAEADDISLAHLNVAVPGSIAQDMPSQARELIQRLKSGIHGADWENDWKVITLFVGGNNLCKACLLPRADTNSLTNFISNVTESLDTLHREIPRAFVNLVPAPDVSEQRFLNKGVVCSVLHLYVLIIIACRKVSI